jgi:hypothetical protein
VQEVEDLVRELLVVPEEEAWPALVVLEEEAWPASL